MTHPSDPHPAQPGERHADEDADLGSAAHTQPPQHAPPKRLPWIPIRSLGPSHRPRIVEHLLSLSERDRYLRFGCPASDAHLRHYVDGLDFDRDEIYGVFNRRLRLVAMAHTAFPPGEPGPGSTAEFGGSVSADQRGRGHGTRLFEHAMLHARNRGIAYFYIHALSENAAMLSIARSAGATVHRDGPEAEALLKLPPCTIASQIEQAVVHGAAVLDYGFKQQAQIVNAVVDAIGEVREAVRNVDDPAQQ